MALNPATFGQPGLIDFADGKAHCTPLPRYAMQADTNRYKEDLLQKLIAECPTLLPVKDFLPTTTSLYSLGVEVGVELGGQSGYIDNLLITNEGRIVIVETKLWRNPESTREVVAQILQYGMALSALSVRELEAKLRLPGGQTIGEFVATQRGAVDLVDDFDDALDLHLRRGEMLYLIVSDGIRVSVERIANWLNDGGSAPFKFGLVELRFFGSDGGNLIVVPRTLVKTREVSRHVVVVDVQGPAASTVVATVQDASKTTSGDQVFMQRSVKTAGPPMTRERLVADIKGKKGEAEAAIADRIAQCMEAQGLQTRFTPTLLQYGMVLPTDEDVFHPLISLGLSGPMSHPPASLIETMGDTEFVNHKLRMNQVANFYRPAEASDATKRRNELIPSYSAIQGKEDVLATAVAATRDTVLNLTPNE